MSRPDVERPPQAAPRNTPGGAPSLARSLKIVAWGLLGIRRASAHHNDATRVSPTTVVVAGLLALLVFVGLLIAVVRWVAAGA
ncbi:MAG: DUF2970 domain-containing protein [Burkholderiaceae bacterium]